MAWEKIEAQVLEWIGKNEDLWDDGDDIEEEVKAMLRESKLPGPERVSEIMKGHPRRFMELLRLRQPVFMALVAELREAGLVSQQPQGPKRT